MDEKRKLFRIFQLISRLRSPLGCIKSEIARDFEVSERTIERHFILLQDLGFEITKHQNRLRIENIEKRKLQHEDMIVFSLEEAAAIRDALLSCANTGPLQKSLLDKLYALTELDELSETIYKQSVSRNINTLRTAIKARQQVLLKNYHAVSQSKAKDYLIEPFRFYSYYSYIVAYDVKDKKVKQFKTERITHAEINGIDWQYEKLHENYGVDVFGMTGGEKIKVKLKLEKRARLLLEEEFPGATLGLRRDKGIDYFEGEVYSLKGIGRFAMGLLDDVEIIEPVELQAYVKEKIKKYLGATGIVGRGA
jgi:predicted DNA-binding transcriptional regulator YafY